MSTFQLKDGTIFQIPEDFAELVYQNSTSREAAFLHETPHVMRLLAQPDGNCTFMRRGTNGHGFVLFVPPVKAGDRLQVAWVDTHSACAISVDQPKPDAAIARANTDPVC